MNIDNLINDRQCGIIRFSYISSYPKCEMKEILVRMGLFQEPDNLEEIDKSVAIDVLISLFWKDLAYNSEIMPKEKAREYAQEFMKTYTVDDSKLYSNGPWHTYHESSASGWNPMTESTFDGGVIIVSPNKVVCIWVEDED